MRVLAGAGMPLVCAFGAFVAHADLIHGVEFPEGAVSFADAVVSYAPGAAVSAPHDMFDLALGIADVPTGELGDGYVSLGWAGVLVLRFTDNSLTTSGDNALDLWVFEIGPAVEPTSVEISQNGLDWVSVGNVAGATSGVDIDAYIGFGVDLFAQYSYVRLTDLNQRLSGSPTGGADIDAVGAISSAPPVLGQPVVPEPATLALLGLGLAGFAGRRLTRRNV